MIQFYFLFFNNNIESIETIINNIISPKPPIKIVIIPSQGKVIQKQFPSWHDCPVINSLIHAPDIPNSNGKKAIKAMVNIQIGNLVR